jgi:hypothetical protein
MSTFVKGFDTVVVNFSDPVESFDEEGLDMTCTGTAATKVSVTVVASAVGF